MAEQKIEFVSAIAVAYSNTAPSNTEVLWVDLSIAGDSLYDKIKAYKNGSWVLVNRNAAEILKDLKTVDGAGSGLDADTLQGLTPDQLIQQSGGVPLLSSGKLLVGQADSIGLAKTVSGIATIDTNGVLTLVPGSISHTELTDIGVNTHAQIDSHISDTSNPHSVTATQVGKDTAQWNADRLQGGSLNLGTPGAGQDGYGISWNNGTSSYELVPISADSIYTANGSLAGNRDVNLAGFNLGFTGGNVGVGTATPDASSILDVDSTTQGSRPVPRVTTAQMNAISTPATNLIVFNTDLNSLMRYNGSAWVSMASGYGLFSVTDSNGEPTFYSDLQTALNACKTGSNTLTLHSNVVITSALSILYASGFTFSSLTIDLNGFSITNNEADSSDLFTITLSNNAAVFQRLKIKNGRLIRTSGTGTHYGINNSGGGYANIETPNLIVYCENSYGAYFNLTGGTTTGDSSPINNLGGAIFITNSVNNALWVRGNFTFCNFHAIGKSTGVTLSVWASCFNFSTENTSTGDAMYVLSSNNPQVTNFVVKSNSGKALRADCGVNSLISNFFAKSVSGIAVNEENGSSRISNFTAVTGNAVCMVVGNFAIITDAKCFNNSSSDTISATNFDSLENVKAYNAGSGYGIDAFISQTDKKGLILNCISHSIGGKGGRLFSAGVGRIVKSKQSIFISDLDTSSGHALEVDISSSGEILVENCSMQVKNSGANGLYAGSAQTIKAINNSIIGATTPINANVTISASTDLGDGNRSY